MNKILFIENRQKLDLFKKLLNAALRITPVFLKFLVIILFAEVLSLADYGFFNLIVTSITIGIYLLGVDFYYFSNREIITHKSKAQSLIISSLIVYITIYIIFYIVSTFISPFDLAERGLLNTLILLIISEHFNQECYRILICLKKVYPANLIFFFRTSSWTIIVGYLILFGELPDNPILSVLNYWLVSNFLAIVVTLLYASFKIKFNKNLFFSIDYGFVVKGLKLSLWVFLGTILLKATEYSARYITEIILDSEETAIFTYYSTIAIAMNMYINSVVTSFEYPKLVERVKTDAFYKQLSLFKFNIKGHIAFSGALILLLGFFVTRQLSEEQYLSYYMLLPIMVIGISLMNISLGDHFNLYANKKDKSIISINIYSGLITILITTILIYYFGLIGGALSVLFSGLALLLLRKKQVRIYGL